MTLYASYFVSGKRIRVVDMKGKSKDFCPDIRVTSVYCDIATRERHLEVAFYANQRVERTTIERRSLADKALVELIAKGFSLAYTEANRITIAEILMEQENGHALSCSHSYLGYQDVGGKTYFFGEDEASGRLLSKYVGSQELSRCGSYCDWRETVNGYLSENPALALPLAMGVSAPIATRLKNAGAFEETLLWALIGATSTGKTTCLRLSASAWGKPSSDGAIDNLTGTEKYFFASLANHRGFPNFFDEVSAVAWDFTKAIYTVGLSREGGRCNTDGTPKKRKTWSGAVIFTGETSMFHRTNGNGGLHARLIEFSFSWFSDDRVPTIVNRFVSSSYGTAWQQLIAYIQTLSDNNLIQRCDTTVCEIKKALAMRLGYTEENWTNKKFSGLQFRIVQRLAILLLAVDVFSVAWEMDVNRIEVLEAILKAYDHNVSRVDKIEEFCEDFVQFVARYRSEFPEVFHTGYNASAQISAKGYQDRRKGRSCIWVLANVFEDQLLEHGLDASAPTLRELHRRGIIEHFGDRYRKPYKTGTIQPSCYCFYPSLSNNTPTPKNKKTKKSRQLKSLLAD